MEFANCYEDVARAEAYAELEFPGTYYLAYRDIPHIISCHVEGQKALDFCCGTGRSTRFVQNLGFRTTGVDISAKMLAKAQDCDTASDYQLINPGDLSGFPDKSFDLITAVFTFDNIPGPEQKLQNLKALSRLLKPNGKLINLVSAPHIYFHEWASFSTRAFPENKNAKCGDKVKIIMTDVKDKRPVENILWPARAYCKLYRKAGLCVEQVYRPLELPTEPYPWKSELKLSPWCIYVLKKSEPWSFSFASIPSNYWHRL